MFIGNLPERDLVLIEQERVVRHVERDSTGAFGELPLELCRVDLFKRAPQMQQFVWGCVWAADVLNAVEMPVVQDRLDPGSVDALALSEPTQSLGRVASRKMKPSTSTNEGQKMLA